MNPKRSIRVAPVLVALVLAPVVAIAQPKPVASGQRAMEYVKTLASDSFEGRKGGVPGGQKASAWIAEQFAAWGLTPAGTDGYFQPFTQPVFDVRSASLVVTAGRHRRVFAADEEWAVQEFSGSGSLKTTLVFVGYGIVSPANNWDEYKGVDVKGKVVVMAAYGAPEFLNPSVYEDASMEKRLAAAYERGARGILLLNSPVGRAEGKQYSYPARVQLAADKRQSDMILIGGNNDVAAFIFRENYDSFSSLMSAMAKSKSPVSRHLNAQIELAAETSFQPAAQLRNVLAKIEGSDARLRNEYVIAGGHFDHLGLTADGDVMAGAQDNASGTAVVMEVARAMKEAGYRPKRTLIFALWDGEEQGLFGSEHYVAHPIVPLERTLVYFNYDCVGQGDGRIYFRGIRISPELWAALDGKISPAIRAKLVPTPGSVVGSDHVSFYQAGVQGFAQVTPGEADTAHSPKDKAEYLDPALMDVNCKLLWETMVLTADDAALTIPQRRLELFRLRAASLVDFHLTSFEDLARQIPSTAGFVPLDLGMVRVPGNSLADILKGLDSLSAKAKAPSKVQLLPRPFTYNVFMDFEYGRYDSRTAIMPGVELSQLPSDESAALTVRTLARMGLQWVGVADADVQHAQFKAILEECAKESVLVVLKSEQPAVVDTVLAASQKPGVFVSATVTPELALKVGQRQWRIALEWANGTSPASYVGRLRQVRDAAGPGAVIVSTIVPVTESYPPAMVELMALLAKEPTRDVWGLMGRNFLELLMMAIGQN